MKARSTVGAGVPVVCPKLYAVILREEDRILARGCRETEASGIASGYQGLNGMMPVLVEESLNWPTADQVLQQLQVAP